MLPATRPNLPSAVASEDKEKRRSLLPTDGFLWLDIENRHILEVASLPYFDDHKDPFDRLLVAQSLSELS